MAAALSLVAFAVCLVLGIAVDNAFETIVWRALLAMGGTLVVGLAVGVMAQKMLDENIRKMKAPDAPDDAPAGGNTAGPKGRKTEKLEIP